MLLLNIDSLVADRTINISILRCELRCCLKLEGSNLEFWSNDGLSMCSSINTEECDAYPWCLIDLFDEANADSK
jgi:hypothetical protein